MKHLPFLILSSASLFLTVIALYTSGKTSEMATMGEVLLVFAIMILIALAVTRPYWTSTGRVEL